MSILKLISVIAIYASIVIYGLLLFVEWLNRRIEKREKTWKEKVETKLNLVLLLLMWIVTGGSL